MHHQQGDNTVIMYQSCHAHGVRHAAVPSDRRQRRLRRGPKRINVAVEDSLLFDSSMLLINASSEGAGVHNNSCGLFIIFNQPSLSVF
jgi:hypothetical protein